MEKTIDKTTPENDADKSSNDLKLTILPENFTNEVYSQNINFLKQRQSDIYNLIANHSSKDFCLCSNPDGSPNIIDMKSRSPLYRTFTMEDTMKTVKKGIEMTHHSASISQSLLLGGRERWRKNNPIQRQMNDKLYYSGIFSKLTLSVDNLSPLEDIPYDFYPLIRVNGIGLGYHITELLKSKTISFMTIYEPHLDLFYSSLFTIPWNIIFQYFDTKGKGLRLIIGCSPDEALQKNVECINNWLLPLTNHYFRLNHFQSPEIKEICSKERQADSVRRSLSDAGWYEDQRAGLYLSMRNIRNQNKVYTGKKTKTHFRAFIVGAGPSLNDAIEYIKRHQKDAIIISCGSALTPLLNSGIIPDYEVVQERIWHFEKHEEKHDLELLKEITLLKLNVVSPKIDKFYKDVLIFQKFRDPGSALLGNKYSVTAAVNPTVTNAGIAMCAALGVNEAYLFGVDYGAPKGTTKMHADGTIYDDSKIDDTVESKTYFELPGNLGAVIKTNSVFSWSHQTTESTIANHQNVKWYNVGEGAFIKGAAPLSTEKLPARFKKKINKKLLKTNISGFFDNSYSASVVINRFKNLQLPQVEEYFQAILSFKDSKPQSREQIVHVLTYIYEAVSTGKDLTNYLPASLLPAGFIDFISSVYIQCSISQDDSSAVEFYNKAIEILVEYIDDIRENLLQVTAYMEQDEEIDLIIDWKESTPPKGKIH